MIPRILSGIAMAVAVSLALLYAPLWVLMLAMSTVTTACFLEYAAMMHLSALDKGVWLSILFLWTVLWAAKAHLTVIAGIAPLAIIGVWLLYFRRRAEFAETMTQVKDLVFGVVYVLLFAFPLSQLIAADARAAIFLLLAATHAGDTGAYFAGKHVGKHPFSPRISPKKTWEGFLGGLAASAIAGILCFKLFELRLSLAQTVATSLALGIAASLGDLAESMLKRSRNIKDSGTWIPGHGGILDRVDGLFFSAPLLYFILAFILKKL